MNVANNLSFKLINTSSSNSDYTLNILNSLPVNVFYIDKDLRFQYLNFACESFLGKKKDEVAGKAINEVLGKKILEQMISKLNGTVIDLTSDIVLGTTEHRAKLIFTPDFDTEKEVRGYTVIINEVTSKSKTHEDSEQISKLVNTDKTLSENESLYRDLIEKLPVAIYICDAKGYITLYNKAAVDLWGREPEIGKEMWCGSWRIYQNNGTLLPLDKCPMAIALKEGRIVSGEEINVQRPDGTFLKVMPYPQPIFNSKGKTIGAVNMLLDITDRKKAEETNAKLAAIVQSSDDAIISKTLEGIVTSWNDAAERMFGYTAGEMIGQSILKLIPEERVDEEPKILDQLKRGERIDHFETIRVTKDGKRLNISLTISPVKDGKGNITGASKIARDVTKQNKLSEALRESEERFRYVADTAPVMIWMIDTHQKPTFLNKRWLEFRGLNSIPQTSINHCAEKSVHPDDLDATLKIFNASFNSRREFEIEYRIKRHDGEYRWVSVCGIPRYSLDNTFLGYIGSCIEIHEQKASREELEKLVLERTADLKLANINLQNSNEELERFTYVASHDLQEPLRKIQAFGNLLLERNERELNDSGKNYVNRMMNAANRMQALIEALLEFSRATLIEKVFEKRNLNVVIGEVKREFQEIVEDKEATIEVSTLPDLTIIPFQFKQMISNIISNALKYAKPGEKPVINIRAAMVDGKHLNDPAAVNEIKYCKLTIQDNGIGFDNEHAERIFELFQRLHGRHEYGGSGIGLSICKKIAENHEGFIRAEGKRGNGAAFHIFIPDK